MPAQSVWDAIETQLDPMLVARKGQLYVLCAHDADPAWLGQVYARYYADADCDVAPSLAAALASTYDASPAAVGALPLAVVSVGLEMHAVGTDDALLWLARDLDAKALLGPADGAGWARPLAEGDGWRLRAVRWRLQIGDTLLLSTTTAGRGLSARSLVRLASRRAALGEIARSAARAAGAREGRLTPALVLHVPGFAPVSGSPGEVAPPPAPGPGPARQRDGRRSPIWTALVVAMAALALVLWAKRPILTAESMDGLVALVLTPPPTRVPPEMATATAAAAQAATRRAEYVPPATATVPAGAIPPTRLISGAPAPTRAGGAAAAPRPSPTPSPTAHYSAPRLISPVQGTSTSKPYLSLEWEWEGELAEDEYFDVRLWRMGALKLGVAWTKKSPYVQRATED
ncbi:MAG: hypothetical protein V1772_10605, partial [Chloroflexota bacterium]